MSENRNRLTKENFNNDNLASYPVDRLLHARLIIFDLDGTVYQETHHFEEYGRQLARRLDESVREAYLRDVQRSLSGDHILRYGDSYDVAHRSVVRNNQLVDWTGQLTAGVPSSALEYVDDPWGIYGNIARYYGISADALQAAFLETRSRMQSTDFIMTGMPGLRPAIDKLGRYGVHFALATNSPEPDSRAILGKLGLTGAFERAVFNANKQVRAKEHFQRFSEQFEVPLTATCSIGDHYRNEIRPAVELGMMTVCIDRYQQPLRPDVDVVVNHPTELAHVLTQLAQCHEAQSNQSAN